MIQVNLFAVAALALVAGCVTTPTPTALTRPGKLLTDAFSIAMPGTGRVFVKRDSILWNAGFGCAHRIYIDGIAVAELGIAQSVSIHVKPGDYVLSAELTSICNGTSETSVTVREGETKNFRTSATGDGNITVQPTAF